MAINTLIKQIKTTIIQQSTQISNLLLPLNTYELNTKVLKDGIINLVISYHHFSFNLYISNSFLNNQALNQILTLLQHPDTKIQMRLMLLFLALNISCKNMIIVDLSLINQILKQKEQKDNTNNTNNTFLISLYQLWQELLTLSSNLLDDLLSANNLNLNTVPTLPNNTFFYFLTFNLSGLIIKSFNVAEYLQKQLQNKMQNLTSFMQTEVAITPTFKESWIKDAKIELIKKLVHFSWYDYYNHANSYDFSTELKRINQHESVSFWEEKKIY